ncbi:uncharacterized protein LOC110096819 [Dendrobium catenatum]|uniref:uncharacterized protein LOC110096819 n=1 Tax=Dendrobium catenatum TaxID=906689 RepID=UPI0010A0BD83|nr:uncharacterized protein LOC110096819 [Dendrobium catenatum]
MNHHDENDNGNHFSIIQHFKKLYNSAPPVLNDTRLIPRGKVVPENAIPSLVRPVTNEEIYLAAPNRHLDLMCYLPNCAKATVIALVPKKSHVENIHDFRPICLCNVFHKIIANILACRMKIIMPGIIEKNQFAFISDRIAIDNPILAREIINLFKKKNKMNLFCAKYDIKKAFDTVSRNFLFARMADKGFPSIFINWVKACINDIHFSICLDRSLDVFFSSSTGLRQGCPLSPFLFCIIMDALSCLLEYNSESSGFEGFNLNNFQLTHLAYADDLLVFGKADSNNCEKLKRVINLFSMLTGLHMNLHKSSLIISPSVSCPNDISNMLQIQNVSDRFNYLGIPITLGRTKVSDFAPLIEKIISLLAGWKAKMLSFAGIMQYIKYTITNTVAYWIRSMTLPKVIYKHISKSCSNFLYHGETDGRKLHLISWNNTCKPYSYGGLGIASLQALNFAFNCGIIMRCYNTNSPLVKWCLARYSSPWKPATNTATAFWKNICNTAEIAREKFIFSIGNNSPISILWDHWCLGETILDKFHNFPSNIAKNSQLANWIQQDAWNIPVFENPSIRDFILNIPIVPDNKYHISWDSNGNAKFRDFYLYYFSNEEQVDWHHMVWHKKHAWRFSVYSWMALKGGLKTCDVLASRNIHFLDKTCSLCHNSLETTSHIMFECDYSFKVLQNLIPSFQTFYFRPTIFLAFQHIDNLDKPKSIKNGILLILNAAIYFIWIERNNRKFKSIALCSNSLTKKISKAVIIKLLGWKNGIEIKEVLNLVY